ncbi:DUF997 family protein [Ferrimonas senticii]|uniref:DUF997 family protein n=1 Tax=Ferrimonas senticii TaxID=394566 RepID=UPI0004001596|nr:DUF997 family protein [Ferrimonas senticii]
MHDINPKSLAKGAFLLTLGYFLFWLLGPLLLRDQGVVAGLPLWFWCSCVVAPLLLCLAVRCWLVKR